MKTSRPKMTVETMKQSKTNMFLIVGIIFKHAQLINLLLDGNKSMFPALYFIMTCCRNSQYSCML